MDTYKIDRQLVSVDDLFYIITALSSIGSSLSSQKIKTTIEKMKSLLPNRDEQAFADRHSRLFMDFSMLSGSKRHHEIMRIVETAVDKSTLLRIHYTNSKLVRTERIVEPITIVFKWRSWYLFAYCRLKNDYRLFRLSRIKNPQLLNEIFRRREKSIEEYFTETGEWDSGKKIELVLAFDNSMRPLVEDYFDGLETAETEGGRLIVRMAMPEDGWLYGMVLSYGPYVEVISPESVRSAVCDMAAAVQTIYKKN